MDFAFILSMFRNIKLDIWIVEPEEDLLWKILLGHKIVIQYDVDL